FAQQVVAPIPVSRIENTYVSDKALYIRGGLNAASRVQQFYSLDLTPLLVHSNKLLWKYLNPAGPIQEFRDKMPMAITDHNQALTYFHETGVKADYNLQADRWDAVANPICANGIPEYVKSFQTALVDPKTQLIYIPFGFAHEKQMLVLDKDKGTCTGVPMPTNSKADLFAWSDSKSTIYMVGTVPPATTPNVWEYQFATKTWKNIATGDMFVFDTVSYNWTKAATSPNVRADMACASAGEYFVAWGGVTSYLENITPPEILFYNVKNDKWLNQTEIAPPLNATLPVPVSPTSTGSESINTGLPSAEEPTSKNKGAVIGGGVAAGVVAIAAIIGFLLYRHRTKQARVKRDPQDLKHSSLARSDDSDGHDSSEEHIDRKLAPHTLRDCASLGLEQYSKKLKAEILAAAGEGGREAIVSVHGQQGPQYHPPSPQYFCVGRDQDQPWHLQQRQPQNSQSPYLERAHRNPHVQHDNAPTDPLEQIALIEAKYDQDREQLRQKQLAALERVRRQWQDDMAASTLREAASNETRQ
ncbi:hypothetical protein BGZ91_008115, partial [Linnemannia elongata]